MKKPIPPLVKHRDHEVEIQPSTAHNFAKYFCKDCGQFIAWLSKAEVKAAENQGLFKID